MNPNSGTLPGLSFLTEEGLLELKGVSAVEDAAIRGFLGDRLTADREYFTVSCAVQVSDGNVEQGQNASGPIIANILRKLALEGKIPRPTDIRYMAGRVFLIFVVQKAGTEALQILLARKRIAELVTKALDVYSRGFESGRETPPPVFH